MDTKGRPGTQGGEAAPAVMLHSRASDGWFLQAAALGLLVCLALPWDVSAISYETCTGVGGNVFVSTAPSTGTTPGRIQYQLVCEYPGQGDA